MREPQSIAKGWSAATVRAVGGGAGRFAALRLWSEVIFGDGFEQSTILRTGAQLQEARRPFQAKCSIESMLDAGYQPFRGLARARSRETRGCV
jgi:hypothetical protein